MSYQVLFLFFAIFFPRNGSCSYNQFCPLLKTEPLSNIRIQGFIPSLTNFSLIVNDYVYTIPLINFNPTIPELRMLSTDNRTEPLEGKNLNQSYFEQITQLIEHPNIQLSYLAIYTDEKPSPFNAIIDIILSDSKRHTYMKSSDGNANQDESNILKNVPPKSNVSFRTVLWPFDDIRSGSYLLQRIDDEAPIRFYSLKTLFHFSDPDTLPWYSLRQINETHAKFVFLDIIPKGVNRVKGELLSQISFGGIAKNHVILLDVTAEWIYVFPYVSLEKEDSPEQIFPYRRARFQEFFGCADNFSLSATLFDFTDKKTIIVIVVLLFVVATIFTVLALKIKTKRNAVVLKSLQKKPCAEYKSAMSTNVVSGTHRSGSVVSTRGPGIKHKTKKIITTPSSSRQDNTKIYSSDATKSDTKRR